MWEATARNYLYTFSERFFSHDSAINYFKNKIIIFFSKRHREWLWVTWIWWVILTRNIRPEYSWAAKLKDTSNKIGKARIIIIVIYRTGL